MRLYVTIEYIDFITTKAYCSRKLGYCFPKNVHLLLDFIISIYNNYLCKDAI